MTFTVALFELLIIGANVFKHVQMMWSIAILLICFTRTEGFAPPSTQHTSSRIHHDNSIQLSNRITVVHPSTKLYMSDEKEGPGLVQSIFISGVLLFFVASAFAPLTLLQDQTPSSLSLGDSVVTTQDGNKLKSYQSKLDALSEAKIQEKLSNIPVFYLADDNGIGNSFYLSYNQAKNEASDKIVKVTTLDQVMFPLILKEGNTKANNKTPMEIKSARQSVDERTYKLVASKAALNDGDMSLKEGNIPLFVVEKLAFASNDGKPQVPLFTEKGDGIVSYSRLRESGGNKLPEVPSIRTTTLQDVLESMQKGTRPGVGQLEFYANADDVIKADEMTQ